MKRLLRWRKSGIVAATAAGCVLTGTTSAHAAVPLTSYDSWVLSHPGHSYGADFKALNDWVSAYCAKAGYGDNSSQCHLNHFTEESFSDWTPHHREQASELLFNCSANPVSQMLSWSHTSNASVTAGYSVGVSMSAGAPLSLVGGTLTVTVSASQSTSWSWGSSSTQSGTTNLTVAPGDVGWFDQGNFYGTAHGVANVEIAHPDSRYMAPGHAVPMGTYDVVTDFTGVMPKQTDPRAVADQGALGLIAESRPMTASERASCSRKGSSHTMSAASSGTPTSSTVVNPR
ncbi:hypothetical protein AB0N17_44935 [Streptomyces sp. NPDC051133]|uniref:hypothetical protein n=1 Tax=Streptomyces sp. NPDC051133 TaxID=3155521 RepID=UPI00343D5F04